ncbi:MAG: DUF4340 domain-containing protein [Candidatus Eisenbacteria bacterium]
MSTRTTIALAVIAAVLAVIALATRRAERSQESLATGPIFPGARWTEAASIQLAAGDDTVRLYKQAGQWLVATEGDHPADTAAVRGLLEKLELFDRRHLVSNNPATQATFQVDDASGTEVLLRDARSEPLAHFRLGKNGPDFRSQYVRPTGSAEVFLIPDYLRGSFDAARATWRDRTIFAFDPQRALRLMIQPEEAAPIDIHRTPAGDFVIAAADSVPAKKSLVESTIRALSTLRADAFPAAAISFEEAGLAPPLQQVRVDLEDGGARTLLIGRETEGDRIFVAAAGRETVFLLSKGRLGTLVRDLATLREESPAAAPPAAPSAGR